MFSTAIRTATLVAMTLSLPTLAWSEDRGTKEEARAMVDAALVHIKKVGPDKAYKDFTDKANAEWHNKDVYVFVQSFDLVVLAQGGNAKLVGVNVADLKDQDGKFFIREQAATAKKGGGWVSYEWVHPLTKKVEQKVSYVHKIDGVEAYVGAGVYASK